MTRRTTAVATKRECRRKPRISDLVNVRFGPLCGLKSDISRGPRSASFQTSRCDKAERSFDLHFLDNDLHFLENTRVTFV
jgi:hypothetical protein